MALSTAAAVLIATAVSTTTTLVVANQEKKAAQGAANRQIDLIKRGTAKAEAAVTALKAADALAAKKAKDKKSARAKLAASAGRPSTFTSSAFGLVSKAPVAKKKLLGE